MKQIFSIKSLIFVGLVLFAVSACSKKYRYDFMNGYTEPEANDSIDLEIDTSKFKPDYSKIGDARLFPGVMSDDEPRLKDYEVTLDIDYETVTSSQLRVSVVPQPWFSTGLYAPAGEVVEIVVPEDVYGLEAQVGVWTDNLSGKDQLLRDPLIINKISLFPGKNYIQNLYGGPLIVVASRSIGQEVTLKVSGAAKSPDFVLGETTDAEWKTMIENSTVPWFELRGERIVFDLPKGKLSTFPLNNPTELMKAWDSVITEDYNKWYGLSDHPSDPRDLAPQLPWREVLDIQPSAGYAHSGFPVVAKLDDNWFRQITHVSAIRNSSNWGTLHEIGHNFQMGSTWKWGELGEVSNNLHSFKVANRYGHVHNKMSSGDFSSALSWAESDDPDKKFADLNVTERLTPFAQIFEKYGYDFQTYLTTEARHDQHTALNDQLKVDFYYKRLSEYVQMDMIVWMHHWGLYPSPQAEDEISTQFPPLNENVWEFNPWTGQGGDNPIFVSRSEWDLLGYDSQNSGHPVTNVFDGDEGSFWNTEYQGTKDPYPHYFTVDMTEDQLVNGFYFLNRSGNPYHQNPKTINIYVGDNPNSLTKVIDEETLPDATDKMKVDLPAGTGSFRYFKIEFVIGWNSSQPVMDLAEVGIY